MKKIIIVLFVLLLTPVAFADTTEWTKYFKLTDNSATFFEFFPITKQEYKELDKTDKKYYQRMLKINKLIKKEKFSKAHSLYDNFLPIYMSELLYYSDKEMIQNAINCMLKMIEINKYEKVLNDDDLKFGLAILYFRNSEYENFVKTIEPFKNDKECQNERFYYMFALSHSRIGNYNLSINYAKKIENSNNYKLSAYNLLYSNYALLKNNQQARLYAIKLASLQPSATNYYKVIYTTQSKAEKLKYYYLIADEYIYVGTKEKDTAGLSIMYNDIIPLENEKIKNATKNIKGFIELPDYKIIFDNDYKYMTPLKAYIRCKNFYNAVNNGIAKYKGNDLKNCFKNIIDNEKDTTARLIEELRAFQQRYAEQQRLQELRQMNANMQYSNYLQQQQNYQLSRPRYTNTTIRPIGNTYYMNSYSY